MRKFSEYYRLAQKMLNDTTISAMSVMVEVEVDDSELEQLKQEYGIYNNELKMLNYRKTFIIKLTTFKQKNHE